MKKAISFFLAILIIISCVGCKEQHEEQPVETNQSIFDNETTSTTSPEETDSPIVTIPPSHETTQPIEDETMSAEIDGFFISHENMHMINRNSAIPEKYKDSVTCSVSGNGPLTCSIKSDSINFKSLSVPSTAQAVDGFKIITLEEAISFADDYSDVLTGFTSGHKKTIEEKGYDFFVIVRSTMFNKYITAHPQSISYDQATNSLYIIYEPGYHHKGVGDVLTEEDIKEWENGDPTNLQLLKDNANSTVSLLMGYKADFEMFDKIYFVMQEQFQEDYYDAVQRIEIQNFQSNEVTPITINSVITFPIHSNSIANEGVLEVDKNDLIRFVKQNAKSKTEIQELSLITDNHRIFIVSSNNRLKGSRTYDLITEQQGDTVLFFHMEVDDTLLLDDGYTYVIIAVPADACESYEELNFYVDS